MRWTVVLEQEADGGFVATVPALPGCVSQGDSRDEAIANVREAIAAYIEDCRESGEAVPTDGGWEIVEDVQQ
jgi:predicted RNase H-like HicB family nuclease